MIGDILQPTHLLFVLVVALLVLGPKRLPEVGRALGRGLRDFRNALSTDELRDQMISTTTTESAPTTSHEPGEAVTQASQPEPTQAAAQASQPERTQAAAAAGQQWPAAAESPASPGNSEPEATASAAPREPAVSSPSPDRPR